MSLEFDDFMDSLFERYDAPHITQLGLDRDIDALFERYERDRVDDEFSRVADAKIADATLNLATKSLDNWFCCSCQERFVVRAGHVNVVRTRNGLCCLDCAQFVYVEPPPRKPHGHRVRPSDPEAEARDAELETERERKESLRREREHKSWLKHKDSQARKARRAHRRADRAERDRQQTAATAERKARARAHESDRREAERRAWLRLKAKDDKDRQRKAQRQARERQRDVNRRRALQRQGKPSKPRKPRKLRGKQRAAPEASSPKLISYTADNRRPPG